MARRPVPHVARRWAATAVGGLVLLAGTGGATAYALGCDGTGPRPDRPAVAPPARPVAAAAQRAVAELARAVAADGGVGRRRAGCVARELVATEGLSGLVRAGVVAADGRFLDPPLTGRPGLRRSITRAAWSCR